MDQGLTTLEDNGHQSTEAPPQRKRSADSIDTNELTDLYHDSDKEEPRNADKKAKGKSMKAQVEELKRENLEQQRALEAAHNKNEA